MKPHMTDRIAAHTRIYTCSDGRLYAVQGEQIDCSEPGAEETIKAKAFLVGNSMTTFAMDVEHEIGKCNKFSGQSRTGPFAPGFVWPE